MQHGLMSNIFLGPYCSYMDEETQQAQLHKLLSQGYVPVGFVIKGESFDFVQSHIHPDDKAKLKGVIISIGHHQFYQA